MIQSKINSSIVSFSIFLIALISVSPLSKVPFGNIALWWLVEATILYFSWWAMKRYSDKNSISSMWAVQLYLICNVFNICRGILIAENYWDWKNLIGNGIALLIPLVAYVATCKYILQLILRSYIKFTFLLFGVFAFLISSDAYGFYLIPMSFLALFWPVLRTPWKLIIISSSTFVILANLGARSNVIKFSLPFVFILVYYFRFYISVNVYEWIRKLLFITPIILFSLAITNDFNVFNIDGYVRGEYVQVKKNENGEFERDNLKADTRTFLYLEVLKTAQKHNSWWLGRSPARGNESDWFGDGDLTGRGERIGNEVAILNIFTWTGVIGVILYFLAFYHSSYLAINSSKNIFSKILGLYLAFRWVYSWVEDVNNFNLNTLFLWLLIGFCYSKPFRSMTNGEIKYWVWGIFDKRYALRLKIPVKVSDQNIFSNGKNPKYCSPTHLP